MIHSIGSIYLNASLLGPILAELEGQ